LEMNNLTSMPLEDNDDINKRLEELWGNSLKNSVKTKGSW